jgi:SAM-dependent methyltransferase
MAKGMNIDFKMLDVGCGTKPKGDVNIDFFRRGFNPQTGDQIQGEFMSPQKIKNFIISDATHLPFKDESFEVVFSSHTIEHVQNPSAMLREMCRVAKRKVIIRCPHRKGSGAKMPYHFNYFDEDWFKKASDILGVKSNQFISSYDYPITSRLKKICPSKVQTTLPWRALRHFERVNLNEKIQIPFEIDVWLRKRRNLTDSGEVKFVVVYNKPKVFENCFASSPYISSDSVTAYHNINNEPLPKIFNKIAQKHLQENIWFAFCHQDFILQEDLRPRLKGKEIEAIYGPIGIRLAENRLSGMITQTDGTSIGCQLEKDTPVQTLDEMCLIVHSEVFRQGLSFDERFQFHFYGADFCMQAYVMGLDVLAMQLKCQYKSSTLHGDFTSLEYLSCLNMFKEKWKQFLPIRTTTKLIT